MFTSPITTQAERKKQDKDNLLAGNIFKDSEMKMPHEAYVSLLQTVALKPKKKHYKKIL